MPRKALDELGDLQRAIMEIVWEADEATVQQVLDAIVRQKRRKLAYTTVLSAMQNLERLGWLRHRSEGRTYVYRAAQSRAKEGQRSIRKLTKEVFGSDRRLLFEHLIRDDQVTSDELEELARMIRARRKELGDA